MQNIHCSPTWDPIATPVATIGIRGTHYGLVLCTDGSCETDGTNLADGLYGGVVDGAVVATIPIEPEDADPQNPVIRYEADFQVDVAGGMGSYVIVAAYGNTSLGPVHPGDTPFGVPNPIFLSR